MSNLEILALCIIALAVVPTAVALVFIKQGKLPRKEVQPFTVAQCTDCAILYDETMFAAAISIGLAYRL